MNPIRRAREMLHLIRHEAEILEAERHGELAQLSRLFRERAKEPDRFLDGCCTDGCWSCAAEVTDRFRYLDGQ